MKSNSFLLIMAGVLLLCLCISPVYAGCSVTATDNSPYLGDTVHLDVSCDAGESMIYLFLTGPNIPGAANMNTLDLPHNAVVDGDASTFLQIPVNGLGVGSLNWPTQGRVLDAGTYTVYVVLTPSTMSGSYGTISLVMRRDSSLSDLYVTTTPDVAHLIIDGVSTNFDTTCQYYKITPGTHTVEVYQPGYGVVTSSESIPVGVTTSLHYNLVPVSETFPKILFSSTRTGNNEIYVMNADGTDVVDLTHNPSSDGMPAMSPDRTKIAFSSARDGNFEIYVMNADGSGQTRLTNNGDRDWAPAWSPDGTKIAFESDRFGSGDFNIYVMNADGTNPQQLTYLPGVNDIWPVWSPDGSKIAFKTDRNGHNNIYVINADGTNPQQITNTATADDQTPAWSPDGSKIAFSSDRDGNFEIYVMNATGTVQTRITNNADADIAPVWSPDGSKIVYESNQYGNYDIYVMNADGSGQTRLTSDLNVDLDPAWVPLTPDVPVQKAVQDVIHHQLGDDITGVTVSAYPHVVSAMPTVNVWEGSFQFSNDHECSLVAVDRAPEANWEHPISYYCVEADGTTEHVDKNTPATNYAFQYAGGIATTPGEVWQPDDPYVWTPACTNDCSSNYAILIDGSNEPNTNYRRYWNDIAFMYINLKEYGYDPAKITVLMSDGSDGTADRCIAGYPTCTTLDDSPRNLDGIGTGDAGNETVLDAGRTTILDKIESMRPSDAGGTNPLPYDANLLIFTTGHGGKDANGNHYIYAWGGTGADQYITDARLTQSLNLLTQVKSITLVMENCNSGGFKEQFLAGLSATQRRKILFAANGDESSWGNGFSNALTTGYAGHTRYYTSNCLPNTCMAEYDKGADTASPWERITASEAMAYARLHDPFYTSTAGSVAGKEHSDIAFNSLAAADTTTQFLSPCTGSASTSITVKDPASGISWKKGTQHLITWDAKGLERRNVYINLLKSGAVQKVIVPSSPGVSASNLMKYCWNIPTDTSVPTSSTNAYTVRIQTVDTPTVTGTSGFFKILAAPNPNEGSLKITVRNKTDLTQYLGPAYTVTNPCLGTIADSGTVTASSTGTTTPVISPQGSYLVGLILDKYYPVSNAPATVATGAANTPLTMDPIPVDKNTGEVLDWPPYGSMDISSSPDEASIWIGPAGSERTDSGYKTDYPTYYLAPGTYDIQVKKDGYQDSDVRTETIEQPTSDLRPPVEVDFILTPLVPPKTIEGFFAPVDMNGMVNNAKAGQTVPVKWHLVDKNGPVSDPASFMGLYSYEIACETLAGSPSDTLPPENDAGSSGLQYLGDGNWQYNWKTLKSYTRNGGCREMFVRFNDRQELHAFFKFK